MNEALTTDNISRPNQPYSLSSTVFKRLQWTFLTGYLLAAAGDSLQGSYRYVLYDSYGIVRSNIELLNVGAYASSLLIGTFATALADRYGRRLACFLSSIFYILYCILVNFPPIWVLAIASVLWGIGNGFYHITYEAWVIQEHRDRFLNLQSLQRILRNCHVGGSLVAVGAGFLAQLLVLLGGYRIPFNVAILFFISMIIFTWYFWPENYGSKEIKATTTFATAFRVVRADPRIVLLGMASALSDAALYIYVIEWTPALKRAQDPNSNYTLPFGIIHAVSMASNAIGSFLFGLLIKRIRAQSYLIIVFLLAGLLLLIPVFVSYSIPGILVSFVIFDLCAGMNRPSLALLRSAYVPNEVRATIMSYMRVPQIIIMLIILLGRFSLNVVFILCACCEFLAVLCMIALRGLKMPEEPAYIGEADILLEEPTSPSVVSKQPQLRMSFSESIVHPVTRKFDDSD